MPLGPKTAAFFEKLTEELQNTPINSYDLPIDEFRKEAVQGFADLATEFPAGVSHEDFKPDTLCLADGRKVPVHFYCPPGVSVDEIAPTMVYFYGGGFCLNLCEFQKSSCAIMAKHANCKVIMVEPPLVPEHPIEEILQLCYEAVAQLFQQADQYRIDKNNFIIAGCSSGALIAAWITNQALQDSKLKISQQVLISPLVDVSLTVNKNNTYVDFQQQDVMLSDEAKNFLANLLMNNSSSDPQSSAISPYYQKLSGSLPSTLIIVGECDGLRGDGSCYAKLLEQAGCDVTLTTLAGQTHNFLSCRKVLDDPPDPVIVAAEYIREHLHYD